MTDELREWEQLDDRALLTPADVARLFGVHPKTVTRWAEAGTLTPISTAGGHRRYPVWQIRQILQDRDHTAGEIDDELLEPRQAAALLDVATVTLARWAQSGKLDPVITPTGKRRYRLSQILQRLDRDHDPSQASGPDSTPPSISSGKAKDGSSPESSRRRKPLSRGRRADRRRLQQAAFRYVASPDFAPQLNTEQAAALLGVSAATIRYWAETRTIPARKDDSGPVWGWVFDRDELLRWLADLPARRTGKTSGSE